MRLQEHGMIELDGLMELQALKESIDLVEGKIFARPQDSKACKSPNINLLKEIIDGDIARTREDIYDADPDELAMPLMHYYPERYSQIIVCLITNYSLAKSENYSRAFAKGMLEELGETAIGTRHRPPQ